MHPHRRRPIATITQQFPGQTTTPAARGRIRTYAYWACTISLAFMMVSGAYGEYTHQYGTPRATRSWATRPTS
ncbi:hypothetical protein ACWDUL_26545 [Nocardia niigatensis]|uniref:hypothetical protein n=1 Tax=Nocardia niigatensis TaxID=209249 RepID=UPI001C3F4665|nr:hypothetical protein [Nocardia niigatensis]